MSLKCIIYMTLVIIKYTYLYTHPGPADHNCPTHCHQAVTTKAQTIPAGFFFFFLLLQQSFFFPQQSVFQICGYVDTESNIKPTLDELWIRSSESMMNSRATQAPKSFFYYSQLITLKYTSKITILKLRLEKFDD